LNYHAFDYNLIPVKGVEVLRVILDSSSLITCCQAITIEGPVIELVLAICEVSIPLAVQEEVAKANSKYAYE
jgi:rRNA-processing protein FCF1